MIEDGLFDRFPCDAIFAMHNLPGFRPGQLLLREGATMASSENILVHIEGKGGSKPEAQKIPSPVRTLIQSNHVNSVWPVTTQTIRSGLQVQRRQCSESRSSKTAIAPAAFYSIAAVHRLNAQSVRTPSSPVHWCHGWPKFDPTTVGSAGMALAVAWKSME